MGFIRASTMPVVLTVIALGVAVRAESPFAARVVEYYPAPGQWVNDTRFNNPTVSLGRPYAGGFDDLGHSSLVSLGGFGGSITLAFDHTVEDEPLNPFGVDAIVFGNAFWIAVGGPPDPNVHWAECATIEISLDENNNGEADDTWYLIPGSHIPDPDGQLLVVAWDCNVNDDTYPPEFASWIPSGFTGTWTTQAYELPYDVFGPPRVTNPSSDPTREGIFGYAEYSPTLGLGGEAADCIADTLDGMGKLVCPCLTIARASSRLPMPPSPVSATFVGIQPALRPEEIYTEPDDPLEVGITPGSGGGDAFDIAWAIDPLTGLPADLPGFDFIRLTTAVDAVDFGNPDQPALFEKSAEIDAVADVAPDPFGDFEDDGDIDLADAAGLQRCFATGDFSGSPCERMDRQPDGFIDLVDATAFAERLTGPR